MTVRLKSDAAVLKLSAKLLTSKARMAGFSMIELMVAMTLGLLLTAAVLQTFVSLKRTYEFQEEFSRLQENGRFAIEFLSRDIRAAGFWGCNGTGLGNIQNHLNHGGNADYVFDQDITGSNGAAGTNTAGDAPDTLVLRSATAAINVVDVPATPSAAVKVSDNSGLQEGEILLISDCSMGEIFQVSNDPSAGGTTNFDNVGHNTGGSHVPGNATQVFQKVYSTDAQVFKAQSLTYTIASGASGEPALFRGADELVEGIENFQVLYGEDTDNDGVPNYFVPAGTAGLDMTQVVSIQFSLLVSSLRDNLTGTPQSVDYNGATLTPSDRRIRKVFSNKVALRNRLD